MPAKKISHAHIKMSGIRMTHMHEGGRKNHYHLLERLYDYGRSKSSLLRHFGKGAQERMLSREKATRRR